LRLVALRVAFGEFAVELISDREMLRISRSKRGRDGHASNADIISCLATLIYLKKEMSM